MRVKFISSFFLLLLFLPELVSAQVPVNYNQLDAYIQKSVKEHKVPGLAIAIIENGEVVFQKGYGVRSAETGKPVTPQTAFAIASLSKAFTAAALGMLIEEGTLDWNDKVVDYVPNFKLHDPWVTQEMTIRDLVTHRSGLATFDGDLLWYGTSYDRDEVISRIRYLPLKQQFRSEYGYQNIMFIVAGAVIEAVSGKSWDQFIEERVFEPLDMASSNTSVQDFSKNAERAAPHINGQVIPYLNYDNSGPAASINAPVDDLTNWIKMWLDDGRFGEHEILQNSTVDELLSTQTTIGVGKFDERNGIHFKGYGHGWFLFDYAGHKVAHHGGGLPGYISKIMIVPEKKLGLVVLTNDMSWLPSALMYKVLDQYLKPAAERDWSAEYLGYFNNNKKRLEARSAERQENRIRDTEPSLPDSSYTGIYEDKMYGKARIEHNNGTLVVHLLPTSKLFTSSLEHWHLDTYRIKFRDPFLPEGFVNFDIDENGRVKQFTIDLPNPDFHFHNLVFRKQ